MQVFREKTSTVADPLRVACQNQLISLAVQKLDPARAMHRTPSIYSPPIGVCCEYGQVAPHTVVWGRWLQMLEKKKSLPLD